MEQKYLDKAIEILNKRGVIIESKNKRRIGYIAKKLLESSGMRVPKSKKSVRYYSCVIINFLEGCGIHTKRNYPTMAQRLYDSPEWRSLRYEVLKEHGGRCCLCGRTAKDGVKIHVDHIVPLSKDWSKRLDKNNLQVLCEDCNLGKSNKDCIDWR